MPGTVIGMQISLKFSILLKMSNLFSFKNTQILSFADVRVKEGDHVEKGQPLVVLSAMKMEMVVQAPKAGTIKKVDITNGMKLEGEDLILTME